MISLDKKLLIVLVLSIVVQLAWGSWIGRLERSAYKANTRDNKVVLKIDNGNSKAMRAYLLMWNVEEGAAGAKGTKGVFPLVFDASEEADALLKDVTSGLGQYLLMDQTVMKLSGDIDKRRDGSVTVSANLADSSSIVFPSDISLPLGMPLRYLSPHAGIVPAMAFVF